MNFKKIQGNASFDANEGHDLNSPTLKNKSTLSVRMIEGKYNYVKRTNKWVWLPRKGKQLAH